MPPLSFTHLKYAFATLPIVVKSTPGISMSMPPSLIGEPVAFLPLPRPQTPAAPALPAPTPALFAVELEALATKLAAAINATGRAIGTINLRTVIPPFLSAAVVKSTGGQLHALGGVGTSWGERPCRCDDDVEEQRLLASCEGRNDLVEHRLELVVRRDAARRAAEAPGDRRELDLLERRPWTRPAVLLGEAVHDRVAPVRKHDEERAHAIVRGAPHGHDLVDRRAVADDRDDRAIRHRHAQAHRRRQREAEPALGPAQIPERLPGRQERVQVGAVDRGLLEHG